MSRSPEVHINQDPALWAQNTPANPGLAPDAWTPLKVTGIEKINDNTAHYSFSFIGEGAEEKTSGLTVSSCLLLRSPNGEGRIEEDNGKPAMRWVYSATALTIAPTPPPLPQLRRAALTL